MLPAFFHQIRVAPRSSGPSVVRGPTVEELCDMLAILEKHLTAFEFIVEEDPQRRWIRYRVRR